MMRDSAWPRWRVVLGIAIVALCAVALGTLVWQISRLDDAVGNSRAGLVRERLAIHLNPPLFTMIAQVAQLRGAIASGASSSIIGRKTSHIDSELRRFGGLVKAGPAASLGIEPLMRDASRAWNLARGSASPQIAQGRLDTVVARLETLLDALEDNSNLGYDRSKIAQNLSDVAFSATPDALEATARARLLVDSAARTRSITLRDRLALANILGVIRNAFDLTTDNIPLVARELALEAQKGRRYPALPGDAVVFHNAGADLSKLLNAHVLTSPDRAIPVTLIDQRARAALAYAVDLHQLSLAALLGNVTQRAQLDALRTRLQYIAGALALIVLIGLLWIASQFFVYRDKKALRESERESAHLAAELARGEAEEALRLSEAQFRAVFDGAALGIAILDGSGALIDANSVFRAMFDDDIARAIEGHEDDLADVLDGRIETCDFEQHQQSDSGAEIWTDTTISVVHAIDSAPLFAICMFRDKTALKHSEGRFAHASTHDNLTGLPNRALFEKHVALRLKEAGTLLDSFFAVAFVDLQHFNEINESFGRAVGDSVLTKTAQRLRATLDARDIVSRSGGDEFAILIPTLGDILHVEAIAMRLLSNLSRPITVGSHSIYLGANIGIAIGSGDYTSADSVMRDAEIATQQAKTSGSARYAVFNSTMHERAHRRAQLTSDMRLAIERLEFRILYQPIVNLIDSSLVGAEALLRWDHPTEGTINPTEFMPLAEASGLATPIGNFVLQTAASQLAAWRRERPDFGEFVMHVNISADELLNPGFTRGLETCMREHMLAPSDLMLEITESVVLDSGTRVNLTLEEIRGRGFKTCIDDFGTGYSSLRYLQQFKVDAMKIDRGFVAGADGELASEPIVRTLMTLAAAYNVQVVAEGVETIRQRDLLASVGCRRAQGYLFSRPLSAAELIARYPHIGDIPRTA